MDTAIGERIAHAIATKDAAMLRGLKPIEDAQGERLLIKQIADKDCIAIGRRQAEEIIRRHIESDGVQLGIERNRGGGEFIDIGGEGAGSQFDPRVVDAFRKAYAEGKITRSTGSAPAD